MVCATHTIARAVNDRCMVAEIAFSPAEIENTSIPRLLSRVQTGICNDGNGPYVCVPIQRVTIRIPGNMVAIDQARGIVGSRDGLQYAIDADLVLKRRVLICESPGWSLTYFVMGAVE